MMLKQRKSEAWRRFGYPVLISIDFDDFTSPFTLKFLFRLRRYIKRSRQCFIDQLSKQLEFRQKYSVACRIFNSPLGVWISRLYTVSRVWYITWTLYRAAKFKLSCNFVFHFIIWFCLTRTGNYQTHEFDWLKWILTAV